MNSVAERMNRFESAVVNEATAVPEGFERCEVRISADTPAEAAAAANGAAGIGLCRTERMFFGAGRLDDFKSMILAECAAERVTALERLLPEHCDDFAALFRAASSLPVVIRLLDPPLHSFLPTLREIEQETASARSEENWDRCVTLDQLRKRVETVRESNPAMGHRGCRLSVTHPEILEMQVRAILSAALTVAEEGLHPRPEILVPMVCSGQEMRVLAERIRATASEVLGGTANIGYKVGAMIEVPRAAMCAGEISRYVSFLCFDTNDLTQMTYGLSREDCGGVVDTYLGQGIFASDPFTTIDQEGVGTLIAMAIRSARQGNPTLEIGVCGKHSGDTASIQFFRSIGVDYVSCSSGRFRAAQQVAESLQ